MNTRDGAIEENRLSAMRASSVEFEKHLRHQQAAAHSDYLHLKNCLREAAQRFADLADIIEKDPAYDAVGFMRASAERFKAEADAH